MRFRATWLVIILVSAAAAGAAGPFDPRATRPADALREDLRTLWAVLEEGHAAWGLGSAPAALRARFDETAAGLTGPRTLLDFYARLLPLVAAVGDGHTTLELPAEAVADLDSRPILFPFELRTIGGRVFVLRDLSADRGVGEGAELLSVDGVPAGKMIESLLPMVSNDGGIRTGRLHRLESHRLFGRLFALRSGLKDRFEIAFRPFRGRRKRTAIAPGIAATRARSVLKERYPEAAAPQPLYELSFRERGAVLAIRGFMDDRRPGTPAFPAFLSEAFREVAEKGATGLVVDLRGNGGGRDDYGKLLVAHLLDRPFPYYLAMQSRKKTYDLFRLTQNPEADARELADHVAANPRGGFDVLGHPNTGPQDPVAPVFGGRVAVLIDGGTASTTGEVIAVLAFLRRAVFLGEEGGAGCRVSTTFPVTVALPRTGLRLLFPLVLTTLAVAGFPPDRGVVPDVPVAPTIEDLVEGRDPAMEKALALLR